MISASLALALTVWPGAALGQASAGAPHPDWFAPPASVGVCAGTSAEAARNGAIARYDCPGGWVDVFIYDPVPSGVVARDGETLLEAEVRMFEESVPLLTSQGGWESLQFDPPLPLCIAVGPRQIGGALIAGAGSRDGHFLLTYAVFLDVDGQRIKLRASGASLSRHAVEQFTEGLVRDGLKGMPRE